MADKDIFNRIKSLEESLEGEQSDYLKKYLSNAPYWTMESMQMLKKDKNTVFIEENSPADTVYILVEGTVRAVDYRIRGVAYDYMTFEAVKAFGAMEIFFCIDNYMTTLETETMCTFLVMSRRDYEKWIWEDKNALQLEIANTGTNLLSQTRDGRIILFLQGTDRVMYLFSKFYEQQKHDGTLVLGIGRQELAERSGFSIKTVNRAIKKLDEDGFIDRDGHKIIIDREQYNKIRNYLDLIIDQG